MASSSQVFKGLTLDRKVMHASVKHWRQTEFCSV